MLKKFLLLPKLHPRAPIELFAILVRKPRTYIQLAAASTTGLKQLHTHTPGMQYPGLAWALVPSVLPAGKVDVSMRMRGPIVTVMVAWFTEP